MKKFAAYAVVFIVGAFYGSVTEHTRNLNLFEEVKAEQRKKWDDRMDRFLSEKA